MNRTLWIGASGMAAQQLNLDAIAHDLANVNTVGFKRSRAEFAELFGKAGLRLEAVHLTQCPLSVVEAVRA